MLAVFTIWHASLIEMLWTAFGLVGIWFGRKQLNRTKLYIEAVQKLNGKHLKRHRELEILAYGHYRNALFRAAKSSMIVMVGLLAMIIAPAPGMATRITPTGAVITFGLFVLEILIVLPGVLDERQAESIEHLDDEG